MPGRVLVADDEESIRKAIVRVLRHQGYDVEAAEDGLTALRLIRHATYDCLVVDIRMPGMDGLTLYQAVKAFDPSLARRMIFCTGETAAPALLWFLERNGNRLLPKPFRVDQLLEMCDEACLLEERDKPDVESREEPDE
jgi:CheY-like chemotaxis protein